MEYKEEEMQGPPFSVEEKEFFDLFKASFLIENLDVIDSLAQSPNLKKRGLTMMYEKMWKMTKT